MRSIVDFIQLAATTEETDDGLGWWVVTLIHGDVVIELARLRPKLLECAQGLELVIRAAAEATMDAAVTAAGGEIIGRSEGQQS